MNYTHFSNFVFRTPLFPLSFFVGLTKEENISENVLLKTSNSPIVREAIFLAAPDFYKEFEKWLSKEIVDKKKKQRIQESVLKYLSRMSSRCTPFGIFAGTAVGSIGNESSIFLNALEDNKRHTRLDMNFLVAFSQDLTKESSFKQQLKFFPNNSLYKIGSHLRYVEYSYHEGKRVHHIVGVHEDEYLNKILNKANHGAYIKDLIEILVNADIDKEEANDFINQLIDGQLLVSELEPSVSGPEFMGQILKTLSCLTQTEPIIAKLTEIKKQLDLLDHKMGNPIVDYQNLTTKIASLGTDFDLKFLFQTDMTISAENKILDSAIVRKVTQGLRYINKISSRQSNIVLSEFTKSFYERYETREIPLSEALDIESGIGFLSGQNDGDVSDIIDDLVLPVIPKQNKNKSFSTIELMLQKKLIQCIKNNQKILQLTDNDVKGLNEYWEDLPDTMSSMIELVTIKNEQKIIVQGMGGSSASNLLGRFCTSSTAMHKYVSEICRMEEQMNPDFLHAEIVHLPESRTGNILMRPDFRTYEIPYLARSTKEKKYQLPVDDLMIQCKDGKTMMLRSKKLNRYITPHLSNAHNYSNNALPIYQFLANMQFSGKRKGMYFNWGAIEHNYDFLPRVIYKDLIFSLQTWHVLKERIQSLVDTLYKDSFEKEMKLFVQNLELPEFVMLVDGDNELLIATRNRSSMEMLISTVKKRSSFILKEFLHSPDNSIKGEQGAYANQIILSFYNQDKLVYTTQ